MVEVNTAPRRERDDLRARIAHLEEVLASPTLLRGMVKDEMAAVAGLRLVRRSEDFAGAPFDAHSGRHVSTYGFANGV